VALAILGKDEWAREKDLVEGVQTIAFPWVFFGRLLKNSGNVD